MTSCRILGTGVVGGFGSGREAFRKHLELGRVHPTRSSIATDKGDVDLNVIKADLSGVKEHFSTRLIRRYNRFAKMTALAAQQALIDAGLHDSIDRSRLGLILATGYGSSVTTFEFLESYYEDGNTYVSPMTFSNSVLSSAVSATTILMNISGPALTIHQLEASVPLALDTARVWLDSDRVDYVLVGGCDEYCDVLGYTYACQFGQSPSHIDIREPSKQTAVPGEGAAFLLLGDGKSAEVEDGKPRLILENGEDEGYASDAAIIGFDGHADCRLPYTRFYDSTLLPTLSLANLFGSFPTAMMLDIATAVEIITSSPALDSSLSIHPNITLPGDIKSVDIVKAQSARKVHSVRVTDFRGGRTK